jgi:hypothetical protein
VEEEQSGVVGFPDQAQCLEDIVDRDLVILEAS